MNHFSKTGRSPILVVDKEGILGDKLSAELSNHFYVIYVGVRKQSDKSENVSFSEYDNSVPVIPNGKYSHMFVVDNGIWTKGFLSEFIKKARKDNSHLLFIVSLSNLTSFYKIFKKIKNQDGAKIIIFGEVFDKNKHLPFMETAIRQESINVSGDGLSKVYPVFLDDAISGIINVALESFDRSFGSNVSQSVFYLFPKYPPTQISLARMIQKANPIVQIDFINAAKKEREINLPPDGKYLLPDNYSLEKKISELKIENLKIQVSLKKDDAKLARRKQKKFSNAARLLLLLLFLILLPLISTYVFSFLGFVNLGNVKTAIEKGNLSGAQRSAAASKVFFNLAAETSQLFLAEAKIIGQENKLSLIIKRISMGQHLAQASTHGLNALGVFSQVFTGKSARPEEDFTKGVGLLKSAVILFRQSRIEDQVPKDLSAEIKRVDGVIKIIENTIDVLPNIFGFDGKKTYLVLFQNNMELRPGGGFIGSYGLLTVNSGLVEDFSIHDVYDADGQLKEHVEPPFAIRRHLGLVHWYLRDSNFDVDFEKSAQSAALLLSKELGKEVDGVIGVDVSFVKNILEAIGQVYVSDYKERVTSDNLYEVTQSHAEKNFFPGSRQKKEFLSSLFSSMQLSLESRENIPYLALAKNTARSILEKHLLFAFSNKYIQDIFTVNGWSSTLKGGDNRKEEAGIINDFLGINEANLGVNKANFFVERSFFHNVDIGEEGRISETVKIEYQNSSKSWPGGDYVNYLRLILPINTTLLSISIDNVSQELVSAITDFRVYEAKNFVKPLGLEVERYDQDGKTIYGFLVDVKAGNSKSIEIKYNLSQKISIGLTDFSYSLRVFKQPGIENYPYSFSLTYPKNLRVVNGSDSSFLDIATDKEINLDFAQK